MHPDKELSPSPQARTKTLRCAQRRETPTGIAAAAAANGPSVPVPHVASSVAEPHVRRPCPRCHAVFDAPAWNALEHVIALDDGAGRELDVRRCSCGNSLSLTLVDDDEGSHLDAGPSSRAPQLKVFADRPLPSS